MISEICETCLQLAMKCLGCDAQEGGDQRERERDHCRMDTFKNLAGALLV